MTYQIITLVNVVNKLFYINILIHLLQYFNYLSLLTSTNKMRPSKN